ncbi:MAG: transposase [Saprospiraceae bacterium]
MTEATCYYQYQLAYYLQENSVVLSVENQLSVKRFIQMKLSEIKTDKVILNLFVNTQNK